MYGGGEQDIQLPANAIWVHLTYQSAFVDDAGKLQRRHDVYNLDGRTIAAIKTERGMVEPPPQGKPEPEVASNSSGRRKVAAPPQTMSIFSPSSSAEDRNRNRDRPAGFITDNTTVVMRDALPTMAGLVPAITRFADVQQTWMPATGGDRRRHDEPTIPRVGTRS
jgi:hypothetical protein